MSLRRWMSAGSVGWRWAVLASAALHAGGWWLSVAEGAGDASNAEAVPVAIPAIVPVRWMAHAAEVRAPQFPGPASPPATPSADLAAVTGPALATDGKVVSTAPNEPASALKLAAAPTSPVPLAAPELPTTTTPGPTPAATVDGYLPRKALTTGPVPVSNIEVPWPQGMTPSGRLSAVFSLFIDEDGTVRRMVADGPTLTPTLEAAAREVFMAASFVPGKLEGRAVKSLIRIEVAFDSTIKAPVAASNAATPRVVSSQNL